MTHADNHRYITIAALALSAPVVILSLLVPNKRLGYAHIPHPIYDTCSNQTAATDTIWSKTTKATIHDPPTKPW